MAFVKKLKQDLVYGLSAKKKNGRCKEVETRFSVWTVSAKKKKTIVEKWPLVAVVERWSLVEVRLYSEIVARV